MIPFVVTLATMTVTTGAAVWLTHSVSVSGFPDSYFDVLLARIGGVPISVYVLIVAAALVGVAMSAAPFGRYLYAIGINSRAASVARVPVRAATSASYAVAGLLAGITAVLLSARLGAASANMGNDGVVLDVVSACVVGGISIYGGAGRVLGAVLGALLITLLSNSLNLLGVSYYLNLMIKGVVIISFVALDGYGGRRHERMALPQHAGTVEVLSRRGGPARRQPRCLARRGSGADGCERGRQIDADERAGRRDNAGRRADCHRRHVVNLRSPREAMAHGIAFVHQELAMLPSMTVAENVFADSFPTRFGLIDGATMRRQAGELLERLGCDLPTDREVGALSPGDRQMIEIARALRRAPRIMIFDEPTSSLTNREKRRLFDIIRGLKREAWR